MGNPFEDIMARLDTFQMTIDRFVNEKHDKNGLDQTLFLNVKRTAEFLDCTEDHVYKLKGRIPHIIRGARLYYKREDLIAYMESGRIDPAKKTKKR